MKVFLDANVLIDVVQNRIDFVETYVITHIMIFLLFLLLNF